MHSLTPYSAAHVYRVYSEDRLIYIGHSTMLHKRLDQHRRSSWWAPSVTRVHASVMPDVETARATELDVILAERPRWNHFDLTHYALPDLTREQLNDCIVGRLNAHWYDGGMSALRGDHAACCSTVLPRLQRLIRTFRGRFDVAPDITEHEELVAGGRVPLPAWPPRRLRVPVGAA